MQHSDLKGVRLYSRRDNQLSIRATRCPPRTELFAAVLVVALASATSIEAGEKPRPVTAEQVKNADTCLPTLADPPDAIVPFRDGKYSSNSIPFAEMRAMAFGEADDRQIGVVEIVWNTGGSGNWEIVELFREANGKAVSAGVYSPAGDLPDGGTMVGRIDIREGERLADILEGHANPWC
jgi:hypothetical protein